MMNLKKTLLQTACLLALLGVMANQGRAADAKQKKADSPAGDGRKPVNVSNFVRAESDTMIRANMKMGGLTVGKLAHSREPTTPGKDAVIRSNQDTLYSAVVLDLSKPVTLTLPEIGDRYMSAHVINQDHYSYVETKPGDYTLTEKSVGSRFAIVWIRTFADVNDPDDIAEAHKAQDAITLSGGGPGPFEAPDWNLEDLAVIRKALSDVAALGFDSTYAFGRKDEVRPVDFLVGAAAGWAGLPSKASFYVIDSVDANNGNTPYVVTVKDVPVGEFWSITVYNKDGFLEPNDLNRNSYNNVTAKKNDDGSITIHFGGDPKSVNYLPITPGWNYVIRMYEPRQEILDGSWKFPSIEPVK
jgi:hypothetical protein